VKGRSSDLAACIVVVLSSGLNEVQWDCWKIGDVFANDDRSNNQNNEHNQQGKVQHGVANDTSLSEARLLEGVDGWPNLTARSQPEEHDRMELVDIGDAKGGQHDEQDHVSKNEVRRKVTKLGNFAKVFSGRLGH